MSMMAIVGMAYVSPSHPPPPPAVLRRPPWSSAVFHHPPPSPAVLTVLHHLWPPSTALRCFPPSPAVPRRPPPPPAVFYLNCLTSWGSSSFIMTTVLRVYGRERTALCLPVSFGALGSPPAGPCRGPGPLRTLNRYRETYIGGHHVNGDRNIPFHLYQQPHSTAEQVVGRESFTKFY